MCSIKTMLQKAVKTDNFIEFCKKTRKNFVGKIKKTNFVADYNIEQSCTLGQDMSNN